MKKKRLLALALSLSLIASQGTIAFASPVEGEAQDASTDTVSTEDTSEDTASSEDASTDTASAEDTASSENTVAENEEDVSQYGNISNATDHEQLTVDTVSYSERLDEYEKNGYKDVSADTKIVLTPDMATSENPIQMMEKQGIQGILFSEDQGCSYVDYTFEVTTAGLYEIHTKFFSKVDEENTVLNSATIQRNIKLDGETPFDEANNIYFFRHFEEEGEVTKNAIGNEVWPKHVEVAMWQEQEVKDYKGYFTDPLKFYLSEGTHTLRIEYVDQDIVLGDVTLCGMATYPSYKDVQAEYKKNGYKAAGKDAKISFQAEDTLWKNDTTIRRDSNTDPKTEPYSSVNRLLNVIGGSRWNTGNQSLTWEFEVKEDGLYTINMRGQQNFNTGMPSYRQIQIDDEIPFEEMKEYKFEYKDGWAPFTVENEDGEAYQFYLTKGTHTLTMIAKAGPMYDLVEQTTNQIAKLSDIYMKITKITGSDPDTNYEYNLNKKMPELKDDFNELADGLEECADIMSNISNMTTTMEDDYREIVSKFRGFAKDLDTVVSNLSELTDAQTDLGDYILSLGDMPLTVDYFEILPAGSDFSIKTSGFWEKFVATFMNFFASFVKDYDSIGSVYDVDGDYEIIDVWIARGTEWGEILKNMIDEDFTIKTNVAVNLNIMPSGALNSGNVSALMLAITSHTAPDVALGVQYASPVEFAFRDAVADLTQFEDFEEIKSQFIETMFVPYEYEKDGHTGVYAIPETMDFTVIIYRTDIMDSLGLDVPKTWDDLFNTTLPALYQENMSFSFPVDTSASANTPSALRGMTMFLMQKGGSYYTEDGMYSALDSPEAYAAFKQWTDLYTSYGLDAESQFFTRLRTGTQPIGIGTYGTYMQLLTSAPELYGRWAIAPMLGTVMTDEETGETYIDNTVGGISETACQIMEQSEHKEAAWKFLKWWMDENTQKSYGRELESQIGVSARWNTANLNAFNSLPWNEDHIEIITEQLQKAKEQPIVLGGYFTTRHLVNAWNRVTLQNQNPRDALEESVKEINKEIRNKHEEYGFKYED